MGNGTSINQDRTNQRWASTSVPSDVRRSALVLEIAGLEKKLGPVDSKTAFAELGRCLILTAPSGMTLEDRAAWQVAAFEEVRDVPAIIFAEACSHARKTADHPAKIVPAIHGYKPSYDAVGTYRKMLADARRKLENIDAPRLEHAEADPGEREDVASMMAELKEHLRAAPRPAFADVKYKPRPPRPKYCPTCLFDVSDPSVTTCASANCGRDHAVTGDWLSDSFARRGMPGGCDDLPFPEVGRAGA